MRKFDGRPKLSLGVGTANADRRPEIGRLDEHGIPESVSELSTKFIGKLVDPGAHPSRLGDAVSMQHFFCHAFVHADRRAEDA
jgi:hypothetical protein